MPKQQRQTHQDRPEHGDEQVEQQHVGDQQEDDQQQYDQPVGVDVGTRRPLATDNLLRVVCAVDLRHAGRYAQKINHRCGDIKLSGEASWFVF